MSSRPGSRSGSSGPDQPVVDLSLIGRWDPKDGTNTADVMIYAKVTPPQQQHSLRIPFLHLQPLVLQSTLVRVVPLLPDGTSPWGSPGVRALGVSTVAGRKRRMPRGGPLRRGDGDGEGGMVDGGGDGRATAGGGDDAESVGSSSSGTGTSLLSNGSSEAPYDDGSPEDPLPNLMPPLTFDEMDLSSVEGFGGVRLGEVEVEDSSRQDKTISADEQQEEASSIVSSPFPERGRWLPRDHAASTSPEPGVAPFAMAGRRCVSYTRTYDGVMQRVPLGAHEWDRIQKCAERIQRVETPVATRDRAANVAFTPRVDSRGRIISSGSYNSIRSVSPLTAHLAQRLQHGDIDHSVDEEEMAELLPHGHDGPGEFRDKVRGKLRGVRHVMFSEDRHSESESEDKNAEDDEITIAVEDNSLVVCFLQHVRPDPVVIEILLKVRPILLGQNKNYHTFIFSGLPYCRNPAFFDFRVDRDDEEWVFDAGDHDQTATFEPLVLDEPNRLRGQLHLRDATPTQRSIIMRAQRVPSHVEIYGHKIRSKTNALFSWTPDGHVVAEFEIKVYLIDVDVADNVARNMINLILVNGVDDPKEITVNSASGRREKFSLEGPVMKDGEELQSARLLQVSRLVRDSRDSMTISFRKVQESFPCYFHIPLVETGSHRDILEQIVVIHEPRLPLTLAFTPDLSFWRDLGEEKDLLGSRKITRIVDSSAIEYPRVWVNSLEPVCSTAIAVLGKFRNLGFVDKLTYQIEEHSPALWSARNPISLHLRMSFEIEGPVKNGAELSRVHRGLFQVEFITINGAPAKMAFMDEDELVILNHGHEYETVPMKFSVYWVSMQPHTTDTIGGGKMLEFQLPRIHEKLVGRAVCKYPHGPAQITSRSHLLDTPPPDAGPWTVVFTNGKATLSGLQTFSSRMYLQIPAESSRWPPKSRAGSIIADADSLAEGLVFRNSAHDEASSLDGPASTTRLPSPDPSPFSFDGAYSPPSTLRHLSTDFGPNPFAVAVEHKDQGSSDGPTPQEEAMGCLRRVFLLLLIAVTFLGCYYCYMDLGGQSFWAPQSRFHPYQATARSSYERLENLLMEGYADILHDEAPPPTQDHWRGIYTPEPLSVVPATPDADEPAIESGSPTVTWRDDGVMAGEYESGMGGEGEGGGAGGGGGGAGEPRGVGLYRHGFVALNFWTVARTLWARLRGLF